MNPFGTLLSSAHAEGTSFTRADVSTLVDPETAPEGTWTVSTFHTFETRSIFTQAFIGSQNYFTRYTYSHSYIDSLGRWHWVFYPYLCNNSCTASFRDYLAGPDPTPPAFIGASGKRWSIFGFGWCSMKDRPLPEQWTRCDPLN